MKLGGLKRKKDLRDIHLARVQPPSSIPEEFLPDLSIYTKYFQNGIGACSAHAGTILKIVQETKETGEKQDFSPRFLWAEIKKIDGIPIQQGSSMRWVFKALQSKGICDFSLAGNNISFSEQEYTDLDITDEMSENAQPRIIGSYAFTGTDEQSLKQAIFQNKAVLLRIVVDEGFFRTQYPTFTVAKWGHLVCAVSYERNNLIIIDSTESDFSKSVKYINRKYWRFITECGTAVDLPNEVVKEQVARLAGLQKLVKLYQQLIALVKLLKGRK